MLTALEKGVKGGKWFSLVDKVYSSENLRASWEKVRSNKGAAGVDLQSIEAYEKEAEKNLVELEKVLREGNYRAKPVKRVWIPKVGSREKRPLGIPVVTDRIVQTAMRNILEPIFERTFAEQSYGFRPGRGCKDALRRVEELLKNGYTWVVDADIKSYFDSIPHDKLMKEVEEQIADGRVLEMIEGYLTQGIMDGLKEWQAEKGTPQGAVISPLLANIYLSKIDHEMARQGYEMVRYADDSVILCKTEEEAKRALEEMKGMLEARALTLHPEKTRIVDATQEGGFDFLGYHFERGMRWPRKKSMNKFKETIRHKTRRTSGESMKCITVGLNKSLKGWYEYFKHSHKTTFPRIDSWIRMRLRSILRKRYGGKGRGRGADHQRWPNVYFANLGLFTLTTAHALACQSRRGYH
ncbi:MAG: group II intron reverse transcriptase/maturase [Candidatus Kuenenia sp.]|nr:group II intron reverse transcriptase/maturase [Candidatus Kuenenia hertensis]